MEKTNKETGGGQTEKKTDVVWTDGRDDERVGDESNLGDSLFRVNERKKTKRRLRRTKFKPPLGTCRVLRNLSGTVVADVVDDGVVGRIRFADGLPPMPLLLT